MIGAAQLIIKENHTPALDAILANFANPMWCVPVQLLRNSISFYTQCLVATQETTEIAPPAGLPYYDTTIIRYLQCNKKQYVIQKHKFLYIRSKIL